MLYLYQFSVQAKCTVLSSDFTSADTRPARSRMVSNISKLLVKFLINTKPISLINNSVINDHSLIKCNVMLKFTDDTYLSAFVHGMLSVSHPLPYIQYYELFSFSECILLSNGIFYDIKFNGTLNIPSWVCISSHLALLFIKGTGDTRLIICQHNYIGVMLIILLSC